MTQAPRPAWPNAPDPAAAQAYLSAATAPLVRGPLFSPKTAAVAGGSPQALGFAVALARAGVAVTLIEDDQHDALRVRETLARAEALTGIDIVIGQPASLRTDLLVEASGNCPLQRAALIADLSPIAGARGLILSLGDDPSADALSRDASYTDRLLFIDTAAPPPHIGLIEILDLGATSELALSRAEGLARLLGAIPLRTPSFIAAPLLACFEDCAEHLIFHGSNPWEVDSALEAFGFDLGPCAAQDLRGLDLAYARHRREDADKARHFPTPVLDRMVPEGRLGRKGSVGWYRYPGGGGRVIDPLIEDLAREEAHFAGITPQNLSEATLQHRLILALIDQAARLHASGVPAPLIDLVATQATGFPAALGGPLFFGAHLGFGTAVAHLSDLAQQEGPHWTPSNALAALAQTKATA